MRKVSENFYRYEFACECKCGFDVVDVELIEVLEDIRRHFNNNITIITSPCRCRSHNEKIGGSAKSQHIFGKAVDFRILNIHADKVADYLEKKYQDKYGIGRYTGRTHIDVRDNKARWDYRDKS